MRRRLAPAAAIAAAATLAMAGAASARVIKAESVLPPGQSGHVSIPGVVEGTGSPHLNDQLRLFTGFSFKPAEFNQPGSGASPRSGVIITRDRYGVPRVNANSDYDAWWGVGYAVAQDRLFQLELFKRATQGRLAEILGAEYLDDDLIARRDYYTGPELDAQMAKVPAALRRRAEAYRDGINAWIAFLSTHPLSLPGEFAGLAITPKDWTLRDTTAVGVFLARTVPSSDGAELDNARVLKAIGPRAFARLLPLRTPGRLPTIPKRNGRFPSQPGRTRRQEIRSYRNSRGFLDDVSLPSATAAAASSARRSTGRILGQRRGSYMWAVTRRGLRSGPAATRNRAFLFNGPQLGYSIPELFVEFELHSPVQDLRGVSAASIPLVGIGHNGRLAWGFTSGLSDEDDLYAERLAGPESYRFRGAVEPMGCRDEVFKFRASPTSLPDLVTQPSKISGQRTERICRTRHGPVQVRSGGIAYARRYAIWNREIETLVGLSALNDADDVFDADAAMQQVTWNENVIAADSAGNIGYWHPGLHPLRPRNYDERLPYPGTGEAEWRDLLPRRRTPHVINPRSRNLVQWNNVPSVGWTNGDSEARERATGPFHRVRILRQLVTRVARDPGYDAHRAIDRRSGTTAQQRPFFAKQLRRARRNASPKAAAVLGELLVWDGSYARTGPDGKVDGGVAIWEEFKDQVEALRIGGLGSGVRPLAGQTSRSHEFDITLGEAFAFRTSGRRTLRRAAERTFDRLSARFGSSTPGAWRTPRLMYDVAVQGAAAQPELPFFDRGTWQQSVALGP